MKGTDSKEPKEIVQAVLLLQGHESVGEWDRQQRTSRSSSRPLLLLLSTAGEIDDAGYNSLIFPATRAINIRQCHSSSWSPDRRDEIRPNGIVGRQLVSAPLQTMAPATTIKHDQTNCREMWIKQRQFISLLPPITLSSWEDRRESLDLRLVMDIFCLVDFVFVPHTSHWSLSPSDITLRPDSRPLDLRWISLFSFSFLPTHFTLAFVS